MTRREARPAGFPPRGTLALHDGFAGGVLDGFQRERWRG